MPAASTGTRGATLRTSVRSPTASLRAAASRSAAPGSSPPRAATPAAVGAAGSASPPARGRGRARRPRTSSSRRSRDTSCTREQVGGSACRHATGVRTPVARGSVGSSRQPGAALGAAVLEHGAAGAGAHAGPEPVLLRPTMGIGLECALHDVLLRPPGVCAMPGAMTCARMLMHHGDARTRPGARATWQGYGQNDTRGNQARRASGPVGSAQRDHGVISPSRAGPLRISPCQRQVLVQVTKVLRCCACLAPWLLSTPVDKRVDAQAASERPPRGAGERLAAGRRRAHRVSEDRVSDQQEVWTAVAQLLRAQLTESVWFSTFSEVVPDRRRPRRPPGDPGAEHARPRPHPHPVPATDHRRARPSSARATGASTSRSAPPSR